MSNQICFENYEADIPKKYLSNTNHKIYYPHPVDVIIPIDTPVNECPICLEVVTNSYLIPCCNQSIHKSCLKEWCLKDYEKQKLSRCPMCNFHFDSIFLFNNNFFSKLKKFFCECDTTTGRAKIF
jgi:hypothetical protein